jgi:hypothetical protein
MLTAAKSARSPLPVLLVGSKEEDFFLFREILERMRSALSAELEPAHSLEEAKSMLQEGPYGVILFEHETGTRRRFTFWPTSFTSGLPYLSSFSPSTPTNTPSPRSSKREPGIV